MVNIEKKLLIRNHKALSLDIWNVPSPSGIKLTLSVDVDITFKAVYNAQSSNF